ncbi:hypothetical protein O181_083209 [Austropuccinia psidii MF-1]|uniref:Uncharacterized protein n=1 Tax=Austropuccinia psidii MF-1 TaxID=1389203 RepID=A0A9Q3FQR1_9BASI|nr:hypothetical protein [Austropuccinia psidii MF-1]
MDSSSAHSIHFSAQANRSTIQQPSQDDGILPPLPKVGDRFETWDDFRQYARRGAETRGFALSQAQSKGSSGTIVLRCSRFKDPGTPGQKKSENGCEVVFKVMKAKNGNGGFEVVHTYDEHNHPYGPHIPTGHRVGTPLPGQPPKRKKLRPTASLQTIDSTSQQPPPSAPTNSRQLANPNPQPVSSNPAPSAPKPFLFDPYTGKPLRSSATPAPNPPTPSPPSHLDQTHLPINQPNQPIQPTLTQTHSRKSSITNGTTSFSNPLPHPHSSKPLNSSQPNPIPPPPSSTNQVHQPAPSIQTRAVKKPPAYVPSPLKPYPPLSIRLSVKAQNSITEFLTSLSPTLTPYGVHFTWVGIQTPADLLEIVDQGGEDELEMFLSEIDTSGIGATGEGVNEEEKILIVRGLRKLRSMKHKS